jgi:NAD(P)-dependent dehydrogenase (short-subunit alcohol dehydrogenase family)
MDDSLSGQVAIVTGGANGIGFATARQLGLQGAAVAIVEIDAVAGRSAIRRLEAEGIRSKLFEADATQEADVMHTVDAVIREFGSPAILVNNCGIYPHIALEHTSLADWRHMQAVNVESMFLFSRSVLAKMRDIGYGRVINFASTVNLLGVANTSAYTATKSAVVGFTRVLASEYGSFGITVNAVAPGLIETETVVREIGHMFDIIVAAQAIKRRGQPEDVAACVGFLASPRAGFITGQTIVIDGGSRFL